MPNDSSITSEIVLKKCTITLGSTLRDLFMWAQLVAQRVRLIEQGCGADYIVYQDDEVLEVDDVTSLEFLSDSTIIVRFGAHQSVTVRMTFIYTSLIGNNTRLVFLPTRIVYSDRAKMFEDKGPSRDERTHALGQHTYRFEGDQLKDLTSKLFPFLSQVPTSLPSILDLIL